MEKQSLSNDEKTKTTSNNTIDDIPSVTQTSKQVKQNDKQNHQERKQKQYYIHH